MKRSLIGASAIVLLACGLTRAALTGITWNYPTLWDIDTQNAGVSNPRPVTGLPSGTYPVGVTYGASAADMFTLTAFSPFSPPPRTGVTACFESTP